MIFPLFMFWNTLHLDYRANLFPISLCVISFGLLLLIFIIKSLDLKNLISTNNNVIKFVNTNIYENSSGLKNQFFYYISFIGYLCMNFLVGFPLASVFFINFFIIFHNKKDYKISLLISIILLLVLWFLSSMLTLQFPNGVIGMYIDLPWWLGGSLN